VSVDYSIRKRRRTERSTDDDDKQVVE